MADPRMQDARRLHEAGRLLDAARLYQRILHDDPKHFEALYGLGMAHAQTGRLNEGERTVGEALARNPGFAEGWRARGLMLMHLGRGEDALTCFDSALAIEPDFADAQSARAAVLAELTESRNRLATVETGLARDPNDAARWNSRGSLLAGMGRVQDALASFDRALSIHPGFVEALCNRATLLLETGKLDMALAGFDAVLEIESELAIGWNNRGNTLARMGRFEEAVASYDRALAIGPEFPEAVENRDFALFTLGRNARSPAKYMRGLFDEFSTHYDHTMLEKLQYRAHLHVRAMAMRVLPRLCPSWRILDLGCGTGLVGLAFQDLASGGWIDGIDLSPRMVEAARARGIYRDLILGDLETVLAEPGMNYDLIVSADTMTYFGDLAPVFSGVAKCLAPGGFYLFASEAKTGAGWEQTKVRRFRHSEAYLRAEIARAGLEFVDIVECALRQEENEPVFGFTVAVKKSGKLVSRENWLAGKFG
jgi:predicted TPR repeat methyltransferase